MLRRAFAILILSLTPATAAVLRAQALGTSQLADSVQLLADRTWQTGDTGAADSALALLRVALEASPDDAVLLHFRGYVWYRKATVLTANKQKREANVALDSAERSLEASFRTLPWPETSALRAAVLGQRIAAGGGAFAAMRLGPRSNKLMDKAAENGPANPRVFLLRGISAFYKPGVFGGGMSKATEELEKALALFENDQPEPQAPAWGLSETYTWLGQAYARQGRVADARAAYARAIDADPENQLVRSTLLPRLPSETTPPAH
jgi:tetratricopeptide (TPR) repeat protein